MKEKEKKIGSEDLWSPNGARSKFECSIYSKSVGNIEHWACNSDTRGLLILSLSVSVTLLFFLSLLNFNNKITAKTWTSFCWLCLEQSIKVFGFFRLLKNSELVFSFSLSPYSLPHSHSDFYSFFFLHNNFSFPIFSLLCFVKLFACSFI